MSDVTLEDTVDIKGGYGAVVLGMGIAGKMITNKIGDITFNYKISNGEVVDWSISERKTDGLRNFDMIYTKQDAIKYLQENKERYYESKDFENLSNYIY